MATIKVFKLFEKKIRFNLLLDVREFKDSCFHIISINRNQREKMKELEQENFFV